MEFNKNEAAILAGSTSVEAAPGAGEIDLYDELIAFAGLSHEEQMRLLVRPMKSEKEAVAPPSADSNGTGNTSSSVRPEATKPQAETIPEPGDSVAGDAINKGSSEGSERSSLSGSAALLSPTGAPSPSDSEDSVAKGKTGDLSQPLFDRSRTGPLLAGLNVFGDVVFSGDLSRGVCLACGAESSAEDLFCVSCGV